MPALVLLGQRFRLGTDDLVLPFAWLVVLFGAWSCVFGVLVAVFWDAFGECERGPVFRGYLVANLCAYAVSLCAAVAVVRLALRGTILQPEARKGVIPVLHVHLVMTAAEVALAVAGIPLFLLVPDEAQCLAAAPVLVTTMYVVIAVDLAAFAVFLVVVFCTFAPAATDNHVASGVWLKLWGGLFFCGRSDDVRALEQATVIVSDLLSFDGGLGMDDLVPSDIMAGIVLMNHHHHRTLDQETLLSASSSSSASAAHGADQYRVGASVTQVDVSNAANYVRFAEAVYGWPLYLENDLCNVWQLVPAQCACLTTDLRNVTVHDDYEIAGDNCLGANAVSSRAMASRRSANGSVNVHRAPPANGHLIYASFHNEMYLSPFMIFADHDKREIIVSVRGTLSFRDALVDVQLNPNPIPSIPGGRAHSGFLQTAANVLDAIESTGILQRTFGNSQTADYSLTFVGHSLGAGTASLLAVLCRDKYPNVRAWAFSPPGCVFNREAAKVAEAYITSVILHTDIVPRLGRVQLDRFKQDVLEIIRNCRANKASVLARGILGCFGGASEPQYDEEAFVEAPLITSFPGSGTRYQRLDRGGGGGDGLAETPTASADVQVQSEPTMFVPGRILHVAKMHSSSASGRGWQAAPVVYEMRTAQKEDFLRLFVGLESFLTHMPDTVGNVLRQLSSASSSSRSAASAV